MTCDTCKEKVPVLYLKRTPKKYVNKWECEICYYGTYDRFKTLHQSLVRAKEKRNPRRNNAPNKD